MTKLRYFYHREVPTGGNGNTINLSKYGMTDIHETKKLKSTHVSNYKQVIEFAENPSDDINLMSIDTGMGGNYFAGHYFTMNADHLAGKLQPMETNFKKLIQQEVPGKNKILKIHPLSTKRRRIIRGLEDQVVDAKEPVKKPDDHDEDEEYDGFGGHDVDGINKHYREKDLKGEL